LEGGHDGATAEQDLARLLDELPQKQAAAIRWMKVEGLSMAQTAARTPDELRAHFL
jgi:DNA-directed RNA polymerase specialized sigma24 family protein